jgi:dTDP-4-dehydrorhamnose reductase
VNFSVNVVLVSRPSPLNDAIGSQLTQRERPLVVMSMDDVQTMDVKILRDAIVIDGDALAYLQCHNGFADDVHAQMLVRRRSLLQTCLAHDVPYLFLSDGRVFDGCLAHTGDCAEHDDIEPASLEGKQLAEYERLVMADAGQGVVLRTGPLIASREGNFLGDCLATMREGKVLALNDALMSCPTPVSDFARVISGIVDQLSCGAPCRGAYHYCSSGSASAYEFAEVVCAFASQFVTPVADIAADEAGVTWQPSVPALSCNQILQDFGIKQLPWRAYLPRMVRAVCEGGSK